MNCRLGLSPKLVGELSKALIDDQPRRAFDPSGRAGRRDRAPPRRTGFVLDTGRIVLAGPTAVLATNTIVREAYLGRATVDA